MASFPARSAAPACDKNLSRPLPDNGAYTALHKKVKNYFALQKLL